MDIDRIKTLLGSADRIRALLARRDAIEEQHDKLTEERIALDDELQQLTGVPANSRTTRTRAPQKCSVCGNEGHSKRTCPRKGS